MRIVFALSGLLNSSIAAAAGQTCANFQITRDTINGGGGPISSDNFRLSGAVGHGAATGLMNSANFRLQGGFLNTLALPTMATLLSVMSRKTHGSAGTFNLPIDFSVPISGAVSVEPRSNGNSHMIVFGFDAPISQTGTVRAIDAAATDVGNATISASGNNAVVTLTGIPDGKRLSVILNGVNGSSSPVSAAMAFLLGDVNGSRAVTVSDASSVKLRAGQITNLTNFLYDVNATGAIGAADIAAVKARTGRLMP